MKNKSFYRLLPVGVIILCSSLSGVWAASITNNDSGLALTNPAAWFGGFAPGLADVAVWDSNITAGTPANATNVLGTNTSWAGIQVLNPAVPLQISAGSTLTNGLSGIDMSLATTSLTLRCPVVLGTNQSWLVTNGQTLYINGVVSGARTLTINGGSGTNGTVIVNAANTYTGGTLLSGGTVVVSNSATFGATGGLTNIGGTIIFGTGTSFTIANPLVFSNTTVLDGNISNAPNVNNTLSLPMSGNGTIIISNLVGVFTNDSSPVETLTLGASVAGENMNNFSGKIVVAPMTSAGLPSGGNIRLNNNTTAANTGSTSLSLNLGAAPSTTAVTMRSAGTVNIGELTGGPSTALMGSRSAGNITATWSIGALNTSTTFAGLIRDCTLQTAARSALTKVGTGTLTLTGTNTYTGNTAINGGFLNAGIAENAGVWGPFGKTNSVGSIAFGGGILQYSAVNNFDYSPRFSTAASQPISIDVNGQNVSFATALSSVGGSLTLTNSTGSGTLTLTAPPTYTGNTTISSGKLVLSSSSGALASGSIISIGAGGTLDVSALGVTYTLGAGLNASGAATAATIVPASGGTFDLNSQPVSLTWSGASSGIDSTHPALTISQGTLNFNNNTITVAVPGTALTAGTYTLISAPAITGNTNFNLAFTGNGLSIGNGGSLSVSNGNLYLIVISTATVSHWTDGSSDQKWSTVGNWDAGVPQLPGDAAIFGSAGGSAVTLDVSETVGGITFNNPGSDTISGGNTLTLDNKNSGAVIAVTAGTANTISTAVSLNDNATITTVAGDSLAISGVVSNAPSVTKALTFNGAGTNILASANTYGPSAGSVGTTLNSPILQVGNNSALGAGDLNVAGNGTLQSGAAGLNLANNITVQPGITFIANNNGNTFTLGGVVSGATGNLLAAGSGTVSLNAVETYGGTTTIATNSTLLIGGTAQLGSGTYAAAITNNGILNYNSSAAQTLSGAISGSGGIQQNGPGNLALSVANTYGGGTLINGGVVQIGNATSLGTGPVTNNGGTILLPSAAATVANNLWFTGTSIIDQNNFTGNINLSGTFAGNGTVVITNLTTSSSTLFSTLTLAGSMTNFTGKIICAPTLTGGFVRFNSGNLPNANTGSTNISFNLGTGTVTLISRNSGGTIDLGELTGGPNTSAEGTRNPGTGTLSIGGLNTSTNFDGTIIDLDATEATNSQSTALTKVGTGTFTLTGVNTYSGPTAISNGVLALTINPVTSSVGSINGSSNIFIGAGATLDLSGLTTPTLNHNSWQTIGGRGILNGSLNTAGTIAPGNPVATGALTITGGLTESSGATNQFALSTNANPNVINVQGTLDLSSGTENITFSSFGGGQFQNGIYPLLTYSNLNGGIGNLAIVTTGGAYPFNSFLTNITTVTPNQIAVVISGARSPTNLVWNGDNSLNHWDSSTSNWLAGATSLSFETGDSVIFTDSGSTNPALNLQATLFPASVVVSNSTAASYTFTGSGSISGSIGLTKTNSGTLTILNTNNYTGPTLVGGGTISIATLPNGGSASPIGAASNNSTNLVFSGGTLAYTGATAGTDRGITLNGSGGTLDVINGTTLTLGGIVTGSGALTLADTGALTLTNVNTYTGGTTNNNGTVTLNNAASAGTGTITLNGGTLALPITGNSTIANGINVMGNATLSLPAATQANPQINGAFTGNGTLNVVMTAGVNDTLGIGTGGMTSFTGTLKFADSNSGIARFFPSTSGTNGSSGCFFDLGQGTLRFFDRVGNPVDLIGALAGGPSTTLQGAGSATAIATTFYIGGKNTNATYSGSIQDGVVTPVTAGNVVSVTKVGTGIQTLAGANTYSGSTIASNGVLLVNGSISTGPVSITGGTLGGSGTINALVTNYTGGTLAPGAGTNAAGTVLTINNNVTLLSGSTNIMQVSHNNNTSDKVVSSGVISYNGTLIVVTNAGDTAFTNGDRFTLFVTNGASGYTGSFTTSNLPPLSSGLTWSNSLAVDGSIEVISNATVTPSAPVASFAVASTNIFVTQTEVFTNTTTGSVTNSAWSFGDGNMANTSGANVTNNVSDTYTNANSVNMVILTASGAGGSSAATNYIVVYPKPAINKPVVSGGSLIFSVSNAVPGATFAVLTYTNLATNVVSWTVATNASFDANGAFNYTNTPLTNAASFFRLKSPYP